MPYDDDFFKGIDERSVASSRAAVPVILSYVRASSVVDIGCGTGAWLDAFRQNGVADVFGVDGPGAMGPTQRLAPDQLRVADLTQPLDLGRRFDLALTLEVAEHLPPESAQHFVSTLVGLAPVVVFSAAIPRQGGTDHLNEQWPSYWAALFEDHGYAAYDVLRSRLWTDPHISFFYAQNMVLYVHPSAHEMVSLPPDATPGHLLPLVHPELYLWHADGGSASARQLIGRLPRAVKAQASAALPPDTRHRLRTWRDRLRGAVGRSDGPSSSS